MKLEDMILNRGMVWDDSTDIDGIMMNSDEKPGVGPYSEKNRIGISISMSVI